MDDLREEWGIQTCLVKRLARNQMKRVRHEENMMAYVHHEKGWKRGERIPLFRSLQDKI